MISYDFRHVILSRAGCSVSLRCQHLASRSGNTAGNNPAEAGRRNYFILFCAVTHVTTEKYIGLLVSPCDPKEGKVVKTQSRLQVKNDWHDGLIKLLSFPMAIRSCWETSTSLVIRDSTVRIQSCSYSRPEMPLASIGAALVWNSWNVKCVFAETDSAEDYADIIMLLFSPLLSFYII